MLHLCCIGGSYCKDLQSKLHGVPVGDVVGGCAGGGVGVGAGVGGDGVGGVGWLMVLVDVCTSSGLQPK